MVQSQKNPAFLNPTGKLGILRAIRHGCVCLGSHGHTRIPRNYSADLLAELARLVAPDGSRAPIPNLDWSGKIEHPCGHSILHLWGDLVGYIDCIALYALIAITGQQVVPPLGAKEPVKIFCSKQWQA